MPSWRNADVVVARLYTCGYCGSMVGPDRGYYTTDRAAATAEPVILTCSYCQKPSYFEGEGQVPGVAYGNPVHGAPGDVEAIYDEARRCFSVSAHTSAVLGCRKLLMSVAVAQGAEEGKKFIEYVDYLAEEATCRQTARAGYGARAL